MTREDIIHLNTIMLVMQGAQQPGYRLWGAPALIYTFFTMRVVEEIAEGVQYGHYLRGDF